VQVSLRSTRHLGLVQFVCVAYVSALCPYGLSVISVTWFRT